MDFMEQAALNNEWWIFRGYYGNSLQAVLAYIEKHRRNREWSENIVFIAAAKFYQRNFVGFFPGEGEGYRWQKFSADYNGRVRFIRT